MMVEQNKNTSTNYFGEYNVKYVSWANKLNHRTTGSSILYIFPKALYNSLGIFNLDLSTFSLCILYFVFSFNYDLRKMILVGTNIAE